MLAENLDWISLMAYDYHGQWDKKTGHLAPMYASQEDDDKTLNAVYIYFVVKLFKFQVVITNNLIYYFLLTAELYSHLLYP